MEHIAFLDSSTIRAEFRPPSFPHAWNNFEETTEENVVLHLADATIAVTNKVPITRNALVLLPHLKLVAVTATGYNNIDVAACRELGVAVCNVPHYASHTVPEHTFSLIFALRRNLMAYRQDVLNDRWQTEKRFCFFDYPIRDLYGSTLGIIGSGTLGQATAKIGEALGMRILFAESLLKKCTQSDRVPLDHLLAESDVVSLHCPLTLATQNLIGAKELRRMKPSALLINTARGGLVEESALAHALNENWIAGAGLDVLPIEPPRNGSPLLDIKTPNLIITPHIAWASEEAMQNLADQVIDNIEAFIAGRSQNLVT